MSTDIEWERWGALDPYFGVITDPRYRSDALDDDARTAFFHTGEAHVNHVMTLCQKLGGGVAFEPANVLDFGCGVGRLVIPFARRAPRVVGMDVSPSMLAEARRNCEACGADGVVLVPSDDALSKVTGPFDLVHSCLVLQHIEVDRGTNLFAQLVGKISPGGFGALHVTFGLTTWASTHGQRPPPPPPPPPAPPAPLAISIARTLRSAWRERISRRAPLPAPVPLAEPAGRDPEMQMNCYPMSALLFILQQAGVQQLHMEMTDHGGAIGAFFVFRRPG